MEHGDLFFRSEAPGLVFSAAYLRGSFAPSAFPSTSSGLRFPPLISREKDSGLPPVTTEKAPMLRAYAAGRFLTLVIKEGFLRRNNDGNGN
jgi:hypothetical protein